MNLLDLADAALARFEEPRRHWLIHFADRESLELIVVPEQPHAEVMRLYPAAVAAQPITDLNRAGRTPAVTTQEQTP